MIYIILNIQRYVLDKYHASSPAVPPDPYNTGISKATSHSATTCQETQAGQTLELMTQVHTTY